ncbi:MmgE/PrpD family protein [Jannaschia marina]|uniref:MmgE/PrpD family protein n=1 Tax=Jannaschia marina TaxID=2741674 RepID=UPI0022A760A7|nr:MmgE/PrpD family protein [Jannaschia marina]
MSQPGTVGTAFPELARIATSFELTDDARMGAIEAIADTVTASAAAPRFAFAKPVQDAYGVGHSAIWFTGKTASAIGAGFANAMTSAALDLDDGHRASRGHPGAAVVPAVFAELDQLSADRKSVTDTSVLRAVAVGYEVALRIAGAKSFYARTGFWAGIAAAAAVGSLRKLSTRKFAHALAIGAETGPHMATTTAPPAWPQPNGTDVKEGIPWGVVTGMAAVPLAKAGMTGPLDLVDHAPFFDVDDILAERDRPMVCESYTKFHAACRHVHGPVEAVAQLMAEHDLTWKDLREVSVEAYSGALRIPNLHEPLTVVDAQYSIPYCIGLVALKGLGCLATMNVSDLGNKDAEAVARRVKVSVCDEFEAEFPSKTLVRVTIRTKDGELISPVTTPSGEADDRPDWSRRSDKLVAVTEASLSKATQADLVSAMEDLRTGDLTALRAQMFSHHEPPQGR